MNWLKLKNRLIVDGRDGCFDVLIFFVAGMVVLDGFRSWIFHGFSLIKISPKKTRVLRLFDLTTSTSSLGHPSGCREKGKKISTGPCYAAAAEMFVQMLSIQFTNTQRLKDGINKISSNNFMIGIRPRCKCSTYFNDSHSVQD